MTTNHEEQQERLKVKLGGQGATFALFCLPTKNPGPGPAKPISSHKNAANHLTNLAEISLVSGIELGDLSTSGLAGRDNLSERHIGNVRHQDKAQR